MYTVVHYSVAKLCPILCNPMDCSTPDSSVLHYLPEFAQIYVHWVGDTMQPTHPLLPPLFLPSNLSQHHDLFQWQVISYEWALHIRWPKYWSFSISSSNEYSGLIYFKIDWFDLLSKELSRVFSSTTFQKKFSSAQPSLWSKSHIYMWLLEKP